MIEAAQFTQPPPNLAAPPPNLQIPPHGNLPNLSLPPPGLGAPTTLNRGFGNQIRTPNAGHFYKSFAAGFPRGPTGGPMTQDDFDGKRLRKSVMRKTVDYNAAIIKVLQNRVWQRDFRDRQALQPDPMYIPDLLPPPSYPENPINAVTTKFVKTATNKMRCPIFTLAWTPEGRRLVTGASSGEFTLWNGLTFNFETILQAHDTPVRTMVWSHNDNWMVTGDHGGFVKYWQSNMNNVKMFQAHKEPLRGISFSPTDSKFVSCSDDGTLRIWDFMRYTEERVLRGHGADVKCVHWHPQKGLIVSGSKDNQQPIKLWDPKSGQALTTLHAHKSTVMDLKWNDNGNWLITASRDHLLKLFDLRNMNQELQIFRGHKKEASSVAWHPNHEGLFCSGGSDGSILFWNVGTDKEVGAIDTAHDSIVWTLAWHPLGHILCSGSNDHTIKFWTRNRPGDQMRDKYNLNTLPAGLAGLDDIDLDEPSVIPGMGPDDKIEITDSLPSFGNSSAAIPGLDLDTSLVGDDKNSKCTKKVPYAKPIPRNFQAQWNDTGKTDDDEEATQNEIKEVITQIVENTPGVVPLQNITPTGIILYGKLVPVKPGSKLQAAIAEGPEALEKYIAKGEIEELHDVMPHDEDKHETYYNADGIKLARPRIGVSKDGSPVVKKSRFSDIDHKPTFIYGDRYNSPIIEQADFKLSKPFTVKDSTNDTANKRNNDSEDGFLNSSDDFRINQFDDRPSSQNSDFGNNGDNSRFDNEDGGRFRDFGGTRWSSGGGGNNQNSNDRPWQNQPPPSFNQGPPPGMNKFPPNFRPPNFGPNGPNRPPMGPNGPMGGPMGPGNWPNPPPRMDFRGRGPFGPNQGPRGNMGPMRGGPPMRGRGFGPRGGNQRGGRVRF